MPDYCRTNHLIWLKLGAGFTYHFPNNIFYFYDNPFHPDVLYNTEEMICWYFHNIATLGKKLFSYNLVALKS